MEPPLFVSLALTSITGAAKPKTRMTDAAISAVKSVLLKAFGFVGEII